MSQCTNRYLSLCSKPVQLLKDGWGGANAKIFMPFCGFVRADGALMVFPRSTVPQDFTLQLSSGSQPDSFNKNSGSCGWIG
jgi:hypothetical protein